MNEPSPDGDPFGNADLDSYDADLNQGLSLSGEGKDFFAQGRLDCLERSLELIKAPSPSLILDYGCGTGNATLELSSRWSMAKVIGVDTSESLLSVARSNASDQPRCQFYTPETLPESLRFDLVYCNGVFHHIPLSDRPSVLDWIRARLISEGYFALWENNSWNPGTRWVMRRIPFDRDAIPLSPRYGIQMLKGAGFRVRSYHFAFIFPKALRALRPLERGLSKLPLGAQYQILCQRPLSSES